MRRYLGAIVPVCTMVMVVGSLNIMLTSNQNLARVGGGTVYRNALVSDKMLDASLAKGNETVVRFVAEPEKIVEGHEVKKDETKIKPLPKDMPRAVVDGDQLNIREGSNKDAPVLTRIMRDAEVGLTGNKNEETGWVEIVVQDQAGTVGWANGTFLRTL
ncbi:hypothetical protein UT300012_24630 [Paraclostridium bifermentans]